jgi:hypothetical protein
MGANRERAKACLRLQYWGADRHGRALALLAQSPNFQER